jgi:hypothetical protein
MLVIEKIPHYTLALELGEREKLLEIEKEL